jgi:hypothetical protein
VQHAAGLLVQAFDIGPADVGEPQSPARIGDGDLSRVQVAREDEVERPGLESVDHLREVAEQDAQVGAAIGEALRTGLTGAIRPRVDPDDLDSATAQLECHGIVGEEPRGSELGDVDALCEGILGDRVIVISQHREAVREPGEQLTETSLTPSPREQIAADQRQVRLPLLDPINGVLDGAQPTGGQTQVEVGEMRQAQPVQLRREAREANLPRLQPNPTSLEPTPGGQACGSERGGARNDRSDQTSSFSSIGVTGTTWRLNLSSESSRPAATPISCERCRIGIWNLRPVEASSFCCQASSER